ncbi:MAG: hypothetical protein NT079_05565 [Candidatus Omnitrophica bacterium]|nr:hypothetical protein [Candidatus Omnitrophota bacterium]
MEKGIAIRVDDLKTIGRKVKALLESPDRLKVMRQAAKNYGKPQAAMDIAKLALE